jgi:hypothetical protein
MVTSSHAEHKIQTGKRNERIEIGRRIKVSPNLVIRVFHTQPITDPSFRAFHLGVV